MSLSVERLKELRAEAYDYGNSLIYASQRRPLTEYESGLLKIYTDTVRAYDELIAIKEAEPVAWLVHAEHEFVDTHPQILGGLPRTPLIRKPE